MSLAATLLLTCALAHAQTPAVARRGDFPIRVRVSGRVVPTDVFRLKSTIDGRVISVSASTFSWSEHEEPLGMLADKELAAILDAHGSTGSDILEERWQRMYKPTKILCPEDCFVLKKYIRVGQILKPGAILFEAARKLSLEGRVRLESAAFLKKGLELEFWPTSDPSRKQKLKISDYQLDLSGKKGNPGGILTADLSPRATLDPGTPWEGIILAEQKKNTLQVPITALIRHGGAVYLPVKISTGITTEESAEIISGVDDGRAILILPGASLDGTCPHRQEVDPRLLCKTDDLPSDKILPPPSPEVKKKKKIKEEAAAAKTEEPPKKEEPERDPDWGPDPYEE